MSVATPSRSVSSSPSTVAPVPDVVVGAGESALIGIAARVFSTSSTLLYVSSWEEYDTSCPNHRCTKEEQTKARDELIQNKSEKSCSLLDGNKAWGIEILQLMRECCTGLIDPILEVCIKYAAPYWIWPSEFMKPFGMHSLEDRNSIAMLAKDRFLPLVWSDRERGEDLADLWWIRESPIALKELSGHQEVAEVFYIPSFDFSELCVVSIDQSRSKGGFARFKFFQVKDPKSPTQEESQQIANWALTSPTLFYCRSNL